jgi:hypothetical protein
VTKVPLRIVEYLSKITKMLNCFCPVTASSWVTTFSISLKIDRGKKMWLNWY